MKKTGRTRRAGKRVGRWRIAAGPSPDIHEAEYTELHSLGGAFARYMERSGTMRDGHLWLVSPLGTIVEHIERWSGAGVESDDGRSKIKQIHDLLADPLPVDHELGPGSEPLMIGAARIDFLDEGIHRRCVHQCKALLAGVIAEWVRSCGELDELAIELDACNGLDRGVDLEGHPGTGFCGSFRIHARERNEDDAVPPRRGLVPVRVNYDDGCGMACGDVFVHEDGSLAVSSVRA